MFLFDWSDKTSLSDPRQIRFFVFESNKSTTSVPTRYVSWVVVDSPKPSPPPPNLLPHPQPPPKAVVVGVESLVTLRHLHRHDGNIPTRFSLSPTLRCQR
jgi:hypothetical protein